jgi:hypothetical protein
MEVGLGPKVSARSLFLHLGYMGFAPDNLPDSDAMRLRACIHSTPHMQARHTTANTCTCTNT